ncbi:hypothetical protein Taro_034175 [Colocasia esculenta]|uniref:Epidermal patterning factor-like protein n=1 Tax=Colocasia esculenta TaxID=4460 RepID=A0A843W3C5_COLES|nr:hypothetical protein [Colocasia esculenta]
MGSCCCCISRHIHLSLLLLLFLLLCSTQVRFLAEGRPISKPPQGAKKEEADAKVMVRALIGSRPPRCDRRCADCGHCKAVQVPAVPQDRVVADAAGRHRVSAGINSRIDDGGSNYKPVSWKCKCGDTIVNP